MTLGKRKHDSLPGLALLALACNCACSTVRVPRVQYTLPDAALAPVSAPAVKDRSTEFADYFCAVLRQENPDSGTWGDCQLYLETKSQIPATLGAIPTKFRVLVIPGLLNMCAASKAEAFSEARRHLHDSHGLTVEYLPLPDRSSDLNAQTIAAYLKNRFQADSKRYIVVGYSKGVADLHSALTTDAGARDAVAAMISVAGVAGGSRLVDLLPKRARKWAGQLDLGTCTIELGAFESLDRGIRQGHLSRHPVPPVPTYSLVAVSGEENTSRILKPTWEYLQAFDLRQDSQLIAYEAIMPGSVYTGAAKADHWAVAMPFEKAPDKGIRNLVDRNHFPRAALLEALVRMAIADLER